MKFPEIPEFPITRNTQFPHIPQSHLHGSSRLHDGLCGHGVAINGYRKDWEAKDKVAINGYRKDLEAKDKVAINGYRQDRLLIDIRI